MKIKFIPTYGNYCEQISIKNDKYFVDLLMQLGNLFDLWNFKNFFLYYISIYNRVSQSGPLQSLGSYNQQSSKGATRVII